jgi:hypothetical protein
MNIHAMPNPNAPTKSHHKADGNFRLDLPGQPDLPNF